MSDIDWNDPAYGVPKPRKETAPEKGRQKQSYFFQRPCDQCHGTGFINHRICQSCGGLACVSDFRPTSKKG